jgi:hypothetical protein
MRGAVLLLGVVICVIAVRPSYGRAETVEENGNDYREVRPSPGAEVENTSPRAQGSNSPSLLGPTIATGTISGLASGGNPELDLRLRPQPNGFIIGELVIHQTGFGMTAINGFMRGDLLQFQVRYGKETYYFEGRRRSDQISGTFESTPSGERGTWTARIN